MKLPRGLSGQHLAKQLQLFGYKITRQSGSHMRLTSELKGQHHLTIPNHTELKLGTLNSILSEASEHFEISKDEVIKKLFYS